MARDEQRSLARSVLHLGKQTSLYVLGDLLIQALGVLLIPIYSHVLTTAEYGVLGIVGTMQKVLVPLFGLGIAGAIARFYFDYRHEEERRRLVGSIWLGWLLLLGGLVASVYLLGLCCFDRLFVNIPFHPYLQLAIGIAALNALAMTPRSLLRVREKAGWFSLLSVLGFLLNALFIIYFVVLRRRGVVGSLLGQFSGALVINLIYLGLMLHYIRWHWDWKAVRRALGFGLPLVPHLLASWALNFADRLILERNVALAAVGLYTLAYQFGQMLGMAVTSLNRAWSPFFYRKLSEGEVGLVTRLITYYAWGLLWLGAATSALAEPVIALLTAPAYHAAYAMVPWIAMAYMMQGFYFLATNSILFTKKTHYLPRITFSAAILNIALNLWLVPRYRVLASAVSTLGGYCALFLLAYVTARRVHALAYEYKRVLVAAALAALVGVVAWSVPMADAPLFSLAVRSLILVGYFPLLLVFVARPGERAMLSHLWRRLVAWGGARGGRR